MPLKSMVASIGTGLVNNALSQGNAQEQREWQEKMWKMQNAYNHPAAMADRMRAAGLNPYMMQGAEPAGSVGTGATAQTIPLDNPLAYAKTFAEIDNLTASTNKTETETEKLLKDMSMLDLLLERQLISNEEYEFQMNKYYEAWKEKNPFTLEQQETEAGIANTKADTALKEEQKVTEQSKQSNLGADTELKSSQKLLTDLQQATEQLRQSNISADTTLKQKQSTTEEYRAIGLDLENKLTYAFGPSEHWANIQLMEAQYNKLVAEKGKIEADIFMNQIYVELERLKLEYQNLWVDKQITSAEFQTLTKNITSLSESIFTISSKFNKPGTNSTSGGSN